MNEQEQGVAIAEFCGTAYLELGIKYPDGNLSFGNSEEYTRQKCENYQRQGLGCELIERLTTDEDFLHDLNAMNEAEKYFDDKDADTRSLYWDYLTLVACAPVWAPKSKDKFNIQYHCMRATASQRAEAFLKTINKWKD